jgi:replicative DNA helicase
MSAPCTDLQLERQYVASLLGGADPKHMRSPQRLNPQDCSNDDLGRVLGVVHMLAMTGGDVHDFAVRQALEAAKAPQRTLDALSGLATVGVALVLGPIAERLSELARARRKREHLLRAVDACERMHVEAADESTREALGESSASRIEVVSAYQTTATAMHQLCTKTDRGAYRSGFPRLDSAIGGFPPATLTVVGGVTGAGKSSLLLAIAMHMSRNGKRVGIVSCEDAEAVWGPRILSYVAEVNAESFYDERITEEFIQTCRDGMAAARHLGIEFVYKLNRPLPEVTAAVRALVVEKRCDIIMVDYIQAIQLGGEKDLRIAIGNATQLLKSECQQHNVPLLLASQLSRPSKDKPFGEPHANALKESGELENKAEIVLLLWKTSDDDDAQTLGKVAKVKWTPKRPRFLVQRNPRTGSISGLIEPPEPKAEARPARGGGFIPQGWGSDGN